MQSCHTFREKLQALTEISEERFGVGASEKNSNMDIKQGSKKANNKATMKEYIALVLAHG